MRLLGCVRGSEEDVAAGCDAGDTDRQVHRTERMDHVDCMPPSDDVGEAADVYAAAPLLNCLLREVAEPVTGAGERRVYRLPSGGRLLRVRGGRRPAAPEVYAAGAWHRLGHAELVKLTAEELRRGRGGANTQHSPASPERSIRLASS